MGRGESEIVASHSRFACTSSIACQHRQESFAGWPADE